MRTSILDADHRDEGRLERALDRLAPFALAFWLGWVGCLWWHGVSRLQSDLRSADAALARQEESSRRSCLAYVERTHEVWLRHQAPAPTKSPPGCK